MIVKKIFVPIVGSAFVAFADQAAADHPTVAFGTEASGPIGTIAAAPMPTGAWAAGFRTELIDADEFSDQKLANLAERGVEDVHSIDQLINTSFALAYGLTGDLTVSVRMPWVLRDNIREAELEDGEGQAHAHGDASGLGDLVFLTSYRALQSDSFNASLQLGFKAPSGDTDVSDRGERLETEFQPGTGSWDLLIGGALSKSVGQWGFHANLLFNETTEGSQDTELGSALFYNVAAVYALSGADEHHHGDDVDISSHPHVRWDVMLEINGERRWKNEIDGVSEANSGGTVVYISPGLRMTYQKLGAFVSIGYPFIDDTDGVQTDVNFRLVGGVSFLF